MKHKRHFLLITVVFVLVLCTAQSLAAAGTGRAASTSPLISEVAGYAYQQDDPGDTMDSRGGLALYLPLILKGASPPDQQDAPGDSMGPEEFRQVFLTYVAWLDTAHAGDADYRSLQKQVQELTGEEFQYIYEAVPDHSQFANAVETLVHTADEDAQTSDVTSLSSVTCWDRPTCTDLFVPVYPSGTGYSIFTASLKDLGLLKDKDGDGNLNNDRCDENRVAAAEITYATLAAVAALLGPTCDADMEPISRGICFAAQVADLEALVAAETVIAQCAFQDALVDSAEIEASYENSKRLGSLLGDHDTQVLFRLDNVVELRTVHLQVIELKEKRQFLVSASEAGRPVSGVQFTSVQVSTDPLDSFIDVTGNTQVRMLEPGIYLAHIDLPQQAKNAKVFSFEVRHNNDIVDHFGFTLFHRGAQNNLGAGQ